MLNYYPKMLRGLLFCLLFAFLSYSLSGLKITEEELNSLETVLTSSQIALAEAEAALSELKTQSALELIEAKNELTTLKTSSAQEAKKLRQELTVQNRTLNQLRVSLTRYEQESLLTLILASLTAFFIGLITGIFVPP